MMPLGVAIVVFIVVEFVYGLSIWNLEKSFIPAVVLAGVSFFAASKMQAARNEPLENPPPEPYRVRYIKAYGTIKDVLATCYDQPEGWKMPYDRSDQGYGVIQAFITVRDDTWRDHKLLVPQRIIEKRVNLEIGVYPEKDGTSKVTMQYRIKCPFPAGRADLDDIIKHTTAEIRGALEDLEVEKHG